MRKVTIRDRVKELRRVPANELVDNPKNWRRHPPEQIQAIDAVLQEIGFAGAELCRELPNGKLMLIDGHARKQRSGTEMVPCLVTDLSEEESDKLLATFDPLGAMAETDDNALNELLNSIDSDSATIRKLLDDLRVAEGSTQDEVESSVKPKFKAMELAPDEHYDFILVMADNVNDWNRLVRILEIPDVHQERSHKRLGMGRAVSAERILELIDAQNVHDHNSDT